MKLTDFTHPETDEEVRTISGRYGFNREGRLPFGEREILFLTGYSVVDSACCGMGGCCFSLVPGFISRWRYRSTKDGKAVSEVEPIQDETVRESVTRLLVESERCTQVNFL